MATVSVARSEARPASSFLKFWKKTAQTPVRQSGPMRQSPALDVPSEIWFEILAHFECYELGAISRVSKHLRAVSLTAYFRTQQFFPFLDTFAFRMSCASTELAGYVERTTARLEFLSAEGNKGAVKEIYVSPYPPGYNRRHRGAHRPIEHVLDRILRLLPALHNLNVLTLQFPACDEALKEALRLLHLESLELEIPPGSHGMIPVPATKSFVFNRNTSLLIMFPPHGTSLDFLFASTLETVVAGPTATSVVVEALAAHGAPFPKLSALDVAQSVLQSPHFGQVLLACPALSLLRIRTSAVDVSANPLSMESTPAVPPDAVPRLKLYHGPPALGASLARGRSLRTVRLWSSHAVARVRAPTELPPILLQMANDSVHTLELGVLTFPFSLFDTIHGSFPCLRTLGINTHLGAFHPGIRQTQALDPGVVVRAQLRLPIGMESLQLVRIGVQLAGEDPEELMTSAVQTIEAFPDNYDPTSWRTWVVDRVWYCVEWARDPQSLPTADGRVEGTLRVEYGTHIFRGYTRGELVSPFSVDEALKRMI
ncbi:unnamed protein product [Mycena citricolor]|uniref:F-box domain-containing protein n=1 Tax=Mycena citricolor TaxID=2018698 RepID=A0AAD2H0V4_9AGAR|nr:unnamed protein product [Mycena citricolor]